MKLVIQIPCLNEADHIAGTLADLPRKVEGFDSVEWLVIDDGSTDGTAEAARAAGADHVVELGHNQGLARAFMVGLETALGQGADVIVNTDADNQYQASGIAALVRPIVSGEAQIVIGARPIGRIEHFSWLKRMLQALGSWTVRIASGTSVPDAPSGFRAMHRDAARQLYVFTPYTYTLETIIQAGRLGIPIASVEVAVNPPTRPSRLIHGTWDYVLRSATTILRVFVLYQPLRFFGLIAALLVLPGIFAFARFLVFWAMGDGSGHVQSLIFGAALVSVGAIVAMAGLLADLVAANRMLLAEIRGRLLARDIDGEARTATRDSARKTAARR